MTETDGWADSWDQWFIASPREGEVGGAYAAGGSEATHGTPQSPQGRLVNPGTDGEGARPMGRGPFQKMWRSFS